MAESTAVPGAEIEVTVAFSPRSQLVLEALLRLPAGTTLGQATPLAIAALQRSAGEDAALLPDPATLARYPAGIWSRRARPEHLLAQGDRLEFYRPLQADPKAARRQRFASQGARAAGLFSKRRPGGKQGY